MSTDIVVTSSDGIRLAVRDHGGGGPDVLFLHGRSRTLVDWPPVLEHLDGVRAVAMDLRWHGRSDVGGSVAMDAQAADVDAVVTQLGLRTPLLVGHSLGGIIATYAACGRGAYSGVVNIDGLDGRMLDAPPPSAPRRNARRAGPDRGDMSWYLEEVERMHVAEDVFGVPEDIADAYIERALVRGSDGTWHRRPPRVYYELGLGDDVTSYEEAVRAATCPVVVVLCVGRPKTPSDRDASMTAIRDAMATKLATITRVVEIEGSHAVIWEKPHEIAAIVRSLL